jgi:activator of 2-hydroxyglutaryl-CoA dehydratase
LDIGSTTIKCVVVDDAGRIVFSQYERHLSQITSQTARILEHVRTQVLKGEPAKLMISGSAGMAWPTGVPSRSSRKCMRPASPQGA